MPSWKKVVASGSDASFSSLIVDTFVSASSFNGTFTGSLNGTASQAISSSFALTASYALNGGSGQGFPFSGSAQITGSLGVTGSFSVNGNTGQTVFASNADTLVISGSLIVTGSSQVTGSLNVRGGITGSLFGTASWAQNSISSSYALTASYALNAGQGGVSAIYILDEGVVQGTASYFDFTGAGVTATVNNQTASIYIPGGGGGSNTNSQNAILSQTSPALTWSFTHNLSTLYPVFTIYDNEDNVIIPQKIHAETTSSAFIYFSSARTGTAVASKGGDVVSASFSATASLAYNALTASFVLPLRQTVVITGSLNVSGSTTQIGNNNLFGNTSLSGSLTISGSQGAAPTINIFGDVNQTGYTRYLPVTTNIDTNISASYIYVSGSTQDLYFSQNSKGYNNTTRLRWLEGNLYTGLLNGGLITSQSSTVYQVASGSGVIVNLNASITDNPYPTIKYLNWNTLSASIAPLSASYDQTFVGIYASGSANVPALFVQGTPFSAGQFDNLISVGLVLHQNRSTINAVKTQPEVGYGFKQRQSIFTKAFGPLKLSGFTLAASGSSTGSLVIGSGTAFQDGANYQADPNNPSYVTDAGTQVSKIFRYHQSGSDWVYNTNNGAGFAVIDPTQYSQNGVLTPVSGSGSNRGWSIQRAYWYPNSVAKGIVVYYGNSQYPTENEAIANINIESFTEAPNTAANAVYIGSIIVRNDANFTNGATYKIIPGGLFRSIGGSGGGGGTVTTTLAGLSDVSISGPTNGQPLVYNTVAAKWQNQSTLTATLTGNADTATSASYAYTASSATSASLAQTASYVVTAQTASYVLNAVSSSYAYTASSAINASASLTSVSASYALTASYAINAGAGAGFPFSGSAVITGSFLVSQSFVDFSNTTGVTGSFSGSLFGTASYATFALSASFAPGFTTNMSQSVAATTWSFTHNLNTINPIVQVYDLTNSQIIPNQIVGMNNSTAEIRFDYAQAGYAVASNGGGLYVTGSTSTLVQTVGAVTWSFTHNLNNKYNTYEVYDDNDYVLIPSAIKALTNNTAELYFAGPQTGRAVAQFSGINGAPNATTASYAVTATSASYLSPITNSFVVLTQVSQSLNFANDAAAAAGGVPLGGLYRSGNFILIRLS